MGYTDEYYKKNKKEINRKSREWYKNNRDKVLAKRKEWRKNNLEEDKKRKREYRKKNKEKCSVLNREYITRRKQEIKEELGGKCERCQFKDTRALHIHHKEPKTKTRSLDYIVKGYDLEKVELLCANCHAIEHFMFYKENNKLY